MASIRESIVPPRAVPGVPVPAVMTVDTPPPPTTTRTWTFAEFYDAHLSFVWRNVRRRVDVESVVDDLTQEVFLVVLRRLPEYEGRGSAKSWVYSILANVVKDYRRAMKRRGVRASADFGAIADPDGDPHASAEVEQAKRLMQALLLELGEKQREVFILAELEQMTAPEIAEALGIAVTAVYARLRDARQNFEAALKRHRRVEGRRV